jgi:hypothetical protein
MGMVIWPLDVTVALGMEIPFKIHYTLHFMIFLTYRLSKESIRPMHPGAAGNAKIVDA